MKDESKLQLEREVDGAPSQIPTKNNDFESTQTHQFDPRVKIYLYPALLTIPFNLICHMMTMFGNIIFLTPKHPKSLPCDRMKITFDMFYIFYQGRRRRSDRTASAGPLFWPSMLSAVSLFLISAPFTFYSDFIHSAKIY